MIQTHRKISAIGLLTFLMAVLTVGSISAQTVIYVNGDATGANDGTSWTNAFQALQDALDAAASGDQIWVAKGSYRPDEGLGRTTGDRSESFQMVSGVRLLGGFSGTESDYVDRNTELNRTLLTGDLLGNDAPDFAFREDNAFHVVTGSGVDNSTLIDGFYITSGNADGAEADSLGGGMLVIDGSPAVYNTVFVSNSASCGGGIYSEGQSPELVNTVFNGNSAFRGGAICIDNSDPTIINATIIDNFADQGAGIFNRNSSPVIVNSILARNLPKGGMLECHRAGYPCTLAEMDPVVITQSTTLSDEVRDHMEAESAQAAVTWLRAQPNVVFAEGDDSAILFRLNNGPQMWVLGEAALGGPPAGGKSPQFEIGGIRSPSTAAQTFVDVVGEDTNGDGKRNNRDKKKVLLLSPFRFEFDPWDEGPELQTLFESVEAYQGEVDRYSNADAGLDKYKIWGNYDVVHVSAHGARLCNGSYCWNTIGTGTQVNFDQITQSTEPGLSLMNIGPAVANTSPDRYYLSLNRNFMGWTYPQGLERTVLMLSACETGDQDTQANRTEIADLAAQILLGSTLEGTSNPSNSVYLGWSEVVPSDLAFNTSIKFYEDMANFGWPASVAKKEVIAQGLGSGPNGEGRTTELRRWSRRGYDLFIREMVTLYNSEGNKLEDGGNITSYFEGVLKDNQPDDLRFNVVVEGIDTGAESDYEISFELDGNVLGSPVPLPSTDAFNKVADYTYSVNHTVSAGRDLSPTEIYTVEAVIDMPGGGQSRYEATNLELNGCYWKLTMGGARAGTYQGGLATFTDQGGGLSLSLSAVDPAPITLVFIPSPPAGPSGPLTLGLGDVGDGAALINFIGVNPSPPFQYQTGDSEDELVDNVVVFTHPGPSNLSITSYEDSSLKGTASGLVWGWTNSDPINPTFESASWSLEFSAESSLNPDGTPRFDACN